MNKAGACGADIFEELLDFSFLDSLVPETQESIAQKIAKLSELLTQLHAAQTLYKEQREELTKVGVRVLKATCSQEVEFWKNHPDALRTVAEAIVGTTSIEPICSDKEIAFAAPILTKAHELISLQTQAVLAQAVLGTTSSSKLLKLQQMKKAIESMQCLLYVFSR